jgi:hypothetical protein
MSILGRINIDVLVHETPSTNTLRVHTLETTQAVSSGKIVTFKGTCGTSWVTLPHASIPDPDFPGATITFSTITRVAMKATSYCELTDQDNHFTICAGPEGGVSSHHVATAKGIKIQAVSGTAYYEVIVIGT